MRVVTRIIDALSESTGIIAYGLIPLVLIVFIEVIARYAFGSPLSWAHESSMYLWGSVAVLAGGYTFLHNLHVRMDIVYNRLSQRGKAIIDVVTALLFFFYMGVLLLTIGKWAIASVLANEHTYTPWGPPLYPLKIVMVIATFLVLLQGFAQFIRNLSLVLTGRELT